MTDMLKRLLKRFGITVSRAPQLVPGDLMRMSVALVDTLQADPLSETVIVRVSAIHTEADGTKTIFLTTTNAKRS